MYILLAGASSAEPLPEMQAVAWAGLDAAGKRYEEDWEDRVKPELDLIALSGLLPGIRTRSSLIALC